MTKIQQIVDTSEADREFVKQFEDDLDLLIGVVKEIMHDDIKMLLSPNIRKLVYDRALLVEKQFSKVRNRIAVDNPGADLEIK